MLTQTRFFVLKTAPPRGAVWCFCLLAHGPHMASFEQIATLFVQHYYQTFDTNRAALQPLYVNPCVFCFGGTFL